MKQKNFHIKVGQDKSIENVAKKNHKSHRSTLSCSHIQKSHKKTKLQVTI